MSEDDISDDENERIDDDYRPGGTAIILIVALVLLLFAILFVFRDELNIPIPQVELEAPDDIPAEARSPAEMEREGAATERP